MGCTVCQKRKAKAKINHLTIMLYPGQFIRNLKESVYSYYTIKQELGSGSFGRVISAYHNITHQPRAIKIINKFSIKSEEIRSRIMTEVTILKSLDHPNIVKIYEFHEDEFNLYLVMDICTGGELLEAILRKGHLDEDTAAGFMRQILSTLIYLHGQKIIHRDLKLENMLIDEPGSTNLKLIDFGAATFYNKENLQSLRVGTVNYIAPEVLNKKYNEKCDLWSAGVIMYVLLSGKLPFRGISKLESIRFIKDGRYTLSGGSWDVVSEEAKDLIKNLLNHNPKTRFDAQQAFNHPWIQRIQLPELKKNLLDLAYINLKSFHQTTKLQRAVIRFIACQLLTSVEKRELSEIYKHLDSQGTGRIDKNQFSSFWLKIFNVELAEDEINEMMTRLDTDKNGFIDYSEFIVAAMDKRKLLSSERLDSVFNAFDKDHNGKISAYELHEMLDDHQELEMSLYQNVIKEGDLNGDGQIDFAEFKEIMISLVK